MMRALELDYRRARRRTHLAAWALLVAGCVLAADGAVRYHELRAEVEAKQALLAQGPLRRVSAAAPSVDADEYAFARDTIRRIAMPWDSFFDALEQARSERVTLLSIEPDVDNGTVSLTGEAKDFLAALTYLAQLSAERRLGRVHLVRHELKGAAGSRRPLAFTISATWREER